MIQRLYVHNFRCLENFELSVKDLPSALLIGKNGVGKSTVKLVLEIIQNICRGVNRVGTLVEPKDFACGRSDVPMRFELEALLEKRLYKYELALELPERFKELRVLDERLTVDGNSVYSRTNAQVELLSKPADHTAQFRVDWHLVALPLIQQQSDSDPLHIFRTWIARTIILSPIPRVMKGESNGESLEPKSDGSNFAEWFTGLLSLYPAAYGHIDKYLRQVMPDIRDFLNQPSGKESKSLIVRFKEKNAKMDVFFNDLSDGERCYFLCAVVLAANEFYGPLLCFWDEPDSYLSLSDVGHFVTSLRQAFSGSAQLMVTSHNPEAIRRFSNENTFVLDRKSHMEPTTIRLLKDIDVKGDLIDALIRGDVSNEQ